MINIDEELRNLYKTDYFPMREASLKKELKLYFPELGKTITNENIYTESMQLTESICSESDLTFGGCESAEFSITIAGVGDEVVGKKMIVTQMVDNRFDMPLGTYKVRLARKKDGMDFKDILAYDRILDSDVDVSSWYNGLTFPMTAKNFRISLYNHLGYPYVEQELPNDAIVIQKTIEPTSLKGRDVLKSIGEINGMFGIITREDEFKYIGLAGVGLYPSETLYPEEDLFPSEPVEYASSASYRSVKYEDYIVESIDSLQIRHEEGDIGVVVGDTTNNPYIIQGNFLCFGMDATVLNTVANNILLNVRNKYYRPHTTVLKGLPYLERGDSVAIMMGTDVVESFVFSRTLSGIQSLMDEISATGNQTRKNEVTKSTEIEQLKAKTLKITKSVDSLTTELSDLEKGTSSKFTQTAEAITTEVTRATEAEGKLSSSIEETLQTIILKVDANGRLASVKLGSNATEGSYVTLSAENLDLNGYVTISALSGNGTTTIDGANIKTGAIKGIVFESIPVGGNQGVKIINGDVYASRVWIARRTPDGVGSYLDGNIGYSETYGCSELAVGMISCSNINGGNPLNEVSPSGSGNTVTSVYSSGTKVKAVYDTRCTFSGISSSSTPNARVSVGGNVAQCASSSMRYKEEIKPIENKDLDVRNLYNVNVKQFKYRDGYLDKNDKRYGMDIPGFIVEQIERYYPIAVDYKDGMPEMWNSNIMIPAMFGLIKDLHERVTELEKCTKDFVELKSVLLEKGAI